MEINHNFIHLNDICNHLNIKISHIFHRSVNSSWHFDNHTHDYNRLYLVLDGHGYLYNEKEYVELVPYNMYLIPANSVYNYRCENYLEKIFIHFKLNIIPNRDILSNINKIITIPSTKSKMENICDIFYKEDIYSAIFCQNLIRDISFKLIEPYKNEIDNYIKIYKKYRNLYKYIDANLSANLSVAEVCNKIGYSQTYIGRQFKTDTGQTIKSYITDILIERIKWLLQSGYSLGNICDELQFNDLSYCSKFFKKHMNISPREYVKKHIQHYETFKFVL